MIQLRITFICLFPLLVWSLTCTKPVHSENLAHPTPKPTKISYLALGDSYTIGESVEENERWPVQLANGLSAKGLEIELPEIIAKTGWRTDQLMADAKRKVGSQKYDVVSLLIGVNNEFQGRTPASFKTEFKTCLTYAIDHCSKGKAGVFVLSIPDYGFTPYGERNQSKISKRLDEYNAICKEISSELGVNYYDITPISREGLQKPTYVANDGLHPSGIQYKAWIDQYLDAIYRQLKP